MMHGQKNIKPFQYVSISCDSLDIILIYYCQAIQT